MIKKMIAAAAILFASSGFALADLQDGASGEMLAAPCAGCHGPNGNSMGPAPSIAGIGPKYFKKVMKNYRKDKNGSTIMNRIAKGYSKAETKLLGKYFSAQTFVAKEQKFDAAMAAKGKAIHKDNCETCHKKNGTDASNNKGRLGGQHMGYLKQTMHAFLNGTRKNRTMKKKLEKAGGAAVVDALVNYYASVK